MLVMDRRFGAATLTTTRTYTGEMKLVKKSMHGQAQQTDKDVLVYTLSALILFCSNQVLPMLSRCAGLASSLTTNQLCVLMVSSPTWNNNLYMSPLIPVHLLA